MIMQAFPHWSMLAKQRKVKSKILTSEWLVMTILSFVYSNVNKLPVLPGLRKFATNPYSSLSRTIHGAYTGPLVVIRVIPSQFMSRHEKLVTLLTFCHRSRIKRIRRWTIQFVCGLLVHFISGKKKCCGQPVAHLLSVINPSWNDYRCI